MFIMTDVFSFLLSFGFSKPCPAFLFLAIQVLISFISSLKFGASVKIVISALVACCHVVTNKAFNLFEEIRYLFEIGILCKHKYTHEI